MTATASEKSQTDALHGPNLILDVENFGPIAEAKNIEFKPMTVFVGPSNTGKTYLAMLLHAFAKAIDDSNRTTEAFRPLDDTQPRRFDRQQQTQVINDFKNLGKLFSHGNSPNGYSWNRVPLAAFSSNVATSISSQLNDHRERVANAVTDTVLEFFGVESVLALTNQTNASETTRFPKANFHFNEIEVAIEFTGTHIHGPPIFLNIPPAYIDYRAMKQLESDHEEPGFFIAEIENLIAVNYADIFFDVPISFYLPAGRTGLLDIRELLLGPSHRGLLGENLPAQEFVPINRAARDFIDLVNAARQRSTGAYRDRHTLKSREPFRHPRTLRKIAELLEHSLIGGQIIIDSSNGATEIRYFSEGFSIPISEASSMVNDIAPILIYSRSYLVAGDLLIIDEPEAHLHPAAQQQMAAALAFMVRSGLRVLITTHSHYMVEQLSAFVNASKLDEETRRRALALGGALGEEDIYLKEDETAVYSFLPSEEHGGSVVKEIFMGDEYEYGPVDHTDATTEQFNRLQSVLLARETAESNGLG